MVGNFIVGDQIQQECSTGNSVVIDRYYASTKAYMIGRDSGEIVLEDTEYSWPTQLYKPDFMFLLKLPQEERIRRIKQRTDIPETREEKILAQNELICDRINIAYERFGCQPIDASGTVESVVDQIIQYISSKNGGVESNRL